MSLKKFKDQELVPTFKYDTKILGVDFKNSLEGFRERHEDKFDISRQSVFFNNLTCFVGRIWRTSCGIIHSKQMMSSQSSSLIFWLPC